MRKIDSPPVPSSSSETGTFSRRLELVIGTRSYREYADSIQVSEGTVRNYLKNGASPKLEVLERICRQDGVNLNWLIAGIGSPPGYVVNKNAPRIPVPVDSEALQKVGFFSAIDQADELTSMPDGTIETSSSKVSYHIINKPELGEEYVLIPGYHAKVPSKSISLNQDEHEVKRFLAFRKKYLDYRRLDPEHLAVVFAAGDAMDGSKGTIKDNDTLLVDLTSNKPLDGKIFVVRLGDEIHPRRIQKGFDGSITLICDNEEYSNQILQKEQVESLEIIGRVVHRSTDL